VVFYGLLKRDIMNNRFALASVALALSLTALGASAGVNRATFRTESNLPVYRTGTPLIYEARNARVGSTEELTSANFLSNPDGWGGGVVHMDYRKGSNTLTLSSQDTWDFQTFHAQMLDMKMEAGESVCGVTYTGGDITQSGIVPTATFTDNSVSISYTIGDVPAGGVFNFSGGQATFSVAICSAGFASKGTGSSNAK
jgi:hypothetical protein